ncbi:MAG: Ig-like domain-containing protein [Clostridia bacterium]|nr:Ig-like domain-containing protein [Clostridia bacterium]
MKIKKLITKISCMALAGTMLFTGQAIAREVEIPQISLTASAVDKALGYSSNYDLRNFQYLVMNSSNGIVQLLNLNRGIQYSGSNISSNVLRGLGYLTSRTGLLDVQGSINGKIDSYRLFPSMYKVSFDLGDQITEQNTQIGRVTYAAAGTYIYQVDNNNNMQNISAYKKMNMYTGGEIEANREAIKEHIVKYGAVGAKIYRNGESYFKWASGGETVRNTDTRGSGEHDWDYTYYTKDYKPLPELQYYCNGGNLTPNHDVTIIGWDDDLQVLGAPAKGAYLVMDNTKFRKSYYKHHYSYEEGRYKYGYGIYRIKGDWVQQGGRWWYVSEPELCLTNFYYVSYYDYYIESNVYGIKEINNAAASKTPYQWDTYGMSTVIDGNFGANVFVRNTKEAEALNSISIANMYDMKYEVYVNPLNGTLKTENLIKVAETGVLEGGYNTITLDKPQMLTGKKFAVVVRYISPDTNTSAKIGVQSPTEKSYNVTGNNVSTTTKAISGFSGVTSAQGRSFIGTSLDRWTDLYSQNDTKNMYICIKAFTAEVPGYKIPVDSLQIQKKLDNGKFENVEDRAIVIKGDNLQLKVAVTPSDCDPSYKEMSWQSDNRNVATVDTNGVVTAVGAGKATITARVKGLETVYTKCVIDVRVPVESLKLNHSSVKLLAGETNILAPIIGPEDATISKVEWASGNKNIVIVTDEGLLIGLKKGKTTVTAILRDPDGNVIKGSDGKTIVAYCNVEVPESLLVDVTGITLNKANLSLQQDATENLKATLIPADATNTSVIWSSSNTNVAVVNANGLVRAIAPGTATITAATSIGEKTARCNVTVTEKIDNSVKSISLNQTSMSLEKDGVSQLVATITPTNAEDKTIIWSSSNYMVADVDNNGRVTAIDAGTATITVETANGKTASCVVSVTSKEQVQDLKVQDIKLDVTGITLEKDDEQKINVSFEPEDAENQNVTWSSSNPSVAKVDQNGLITAVNYGTATITVKTEDGKIEKTCVVEVPQNIAVTGIRLSKTSAEVIVGRSTEIDAIVLPENATNQNVNMEISDEKIITMSTAGIKGLKVGTATVTFTTEDGNFSKTCTVTVKAVPTNQVYIDSPVYGINDNDKEVTGVGDETTGKELKENIKTNEGTVVTVKDKDGNPIEDTGKVGTGATIEVKNTSGGTTTTETFTVIVNGDISGDGQIGTTDLSLLRKYLMGNLETGTYFNQKAADLNGDGQITITDFTILKDMFMNGGNE